MVINPKEFTKHILDIATRSPIVKSYTVEIFEDIFVKMRIFLNIDNMFIDVYYNSDTNKVSFALIKENNRIYGTDNLGYWHIHPFDNPEEHKKSKEVKFEEFLKNIEKRFL